MIKKNHLGFLFLSLSLAGCASSSNRHPSSDDRETLANIIDEIHDSSKKQQGSPAGCKDKYDQLYNKLFNLAGDAAYLEFMDIKTMDEEIKSSFLARIDLKESLKSFSADSECLRSVTDVFKGLRYVEDYLIELRMEKSASGPSEYVDLKGEFPYLLVNPKYSSEFKSYEDLKSGDVILSRGNAFSSAAIARIGINDYQFSHLAFVYQETAASELMTTEAFIEIGSVTAPLIDHINSKNSRSVVYRYQDPQIAHEASKTMYDRVEASLQNKKGIEYDFDMDFKDNTKLYCAEIISSGFKNMLPDEDYFPMFKSKFSPGILPFLNTMGIEVTKESIGELEIFAPGDIQFDPRFELVAEWRNPRKMEEGRLKDFILTALFQRMEKENYNFDSSLKMDADAKALWLLRRTPVVRKFIQNKFPLNMTTSQLELFMAMDKVGEEIYKEVEKASLEFDRPMTPKEIYAVLDHFFKQDFELYKRYKKGQDVMKPTFHLLFHP